MEYQPIKSRHFGAALSISAVHRDEHNLWSNMKELDGRARRGRVVSIDYSPKSNENSVVAWSNEIECLFPHDAKDTKFKINTPFSYNSAQFRSDGDLIVYTVGDRGKIEVVDRNGKLLRSFIRHTGSATGAVFTVNKINIASWGVDRRLCISDLSTEDLVFNQTDAHLNTIFTGSASWEHQDIVATGCGSGEIKLWDIRHKSPVQVICSHSKDAIYKVKFIPGQSSLKLASGSSSGDLRIYDIRKLHAQHENPSSINSPAEVVCSSRSHSKAISEICFAKEGSRVLTSGFDGKLCIHDTNDLSTIFVSQECKTGITAMGCTNDGSEISIGQDDGKLTRKILKKLHRADTDLTGEDNVLHWSKPLEPVSTTKDHQSLTDKHLRAFNYKSSLLSALLEYEKDPSELHDPLYAVIEELLRRNALRIALSGWKEDEVVRLLVYLITHMRHRERCALMITAFEVVHEIYSEELIKSSQISTLYSNMASDVHLFLRNIRRFGELSAVLDSFW